MGARSRPRGGWADSELLLGTVIPYGVPLVEAILAQPGFVEWSRLAALPFAGIFTSALVVSVFYALKWSGPHPRRWRGYAQRPSARILLVVDGGDGGRGAGVRRPEPGWLHLAVVALPTWDDSLDDRLVTSMPLTVGLGALFAFWRDGRGAAGLLVQMIWAYCVVVGAASVVHAAARGGAAL